ncbi:PAS domain-containing sensor histidine kinase [Rhodoferax lacus]|uniref:histidine kinase n=1 Tax=Rhodoferax lacus TaxID=2184758 RepID=A0A3E1R6D4_9BURK|nr:ATP-binding protein [Rhodoferax lacus]RFO94938.1 PAS domain-containing sensor histidine kinase [Rhodoferax lacus]
MNDSGFGALPSVRHSSRAVRRAVTIGSLLMLLIGLVLLYMLMQATNNRDLYERNYAVLFSVNVAVASLLLLATAWVAYKLFMRLRQRRFGSRLLVKLAAIFALVGIAPGLVIYVVSYQFVSRSIETWFDVKVEGALEAGLNLGRVTLDTLSNEFTIKVKASAPQLNEVSEAAVGPLLEKMVDQLGASDIAIWSGSGTLLASGGQTRIQLSPDKPSSAQFRTARAERAVSWIDGLEDAAPDALTTSRIRVLVPLAVAGLGLNPMPRFLLVSKALPRNLVANALAVDAANREYQERALAREGLKRMYIGTLTLSLFLAVFAAVLMAVVLGNQLARPLLVLAEGVSQVAAGDLTPKLAMQGNDELGGLTRAFATMTAQLADARQAVEHSMSQVDSARANLQTILDNLTAGVIVLGAQGELLSANPGATRILRAPLAAHIGQPLDSIAGLADFGHAVQAQFTDFMLAKLEHEPDHWQQTFELGGSNAPMHSPFDHALTIVARGAALPGDSRLLVFDDISEIVSAQRAQAWGEVARRLAHEIKNPLTPIQLSAERLEIKLSGKLQPPEQQVLNKSVKTIVDQVDAMKRLVNEFRDYARLPAAELKPVNLNVLVQDVLQLYETESLGEHHHVPVLLELDAACPPVRGDAQQLRQVIHNLLQNAQDASDLPGNTPPGPVVVRTSWQQAKGRVRLSVLDQGPGFDEAILKRAFEPYVTTKPKGTGLGLAVVKKIADEHGSRVDIANRLVDGKVAGAQVSLSLPVVNSSQT